MDTTVSKVCKGCQVVGPLENFYKDAKCKQGVKPRCKICVDAQKNVYRSQSRQKINEASCKYYHDHKEQIKKYQAEYRDGHKEHFAAYREAHKEVIAIQKSAWSKANREKRQAAASFRLKTNVQARIAHNMRGRFRAALKSKSVTKSSSVMDLIGCSRDDLFSHLTKLFVGDMSWSNYGRWHIDHIKPVAQFNLTDLDEQRQCFHYTNLQPLWAIDNLRKGSK